MIGRPVLLARSLQLPFACNSAGRAEGADPDGSAARRRRGQPRADPTLLESGDTFTGSVKTLSINAKATIKAADKGDDPSFPAPLPTAYRHVRGIAPVRNRGNPIRFGKFHIRMGARTARI